MNNLRYKILFIGKLGTSVIYASTIEQARHIAESCLNLHIKEQCFIFKKGLNGYKRIN